MSNYPVEKKYTREELIQKVQKVKKMAEKSSKAGKNGKTLGEERFIDTDQGRIRVLGYNLEHPGSLPLFVNFHGGGFVFGHPEMDDPYLPFLAETAGIKILSIDYSLSPESMFPTALNECYAAVKYAQVHPAEFGIDPGLVAVGGHSAGGNLSAGVVLLNGERRELDLRALILDYPPVDLYTDAYRKPRGKGFVGRVFLSPKVSRIFDACYLNDKEGRKNPLISPVYASPEQLQEFPPTLLLTAGKDSLCREAERLKDQLIEAGVEVSHKRFEKAPHGFTLSKSADAQEAWLLMAEHLKANLSSDTVLS